MAASAAVRVRFEHDGYPIVLCATVRAFSRRQQASGLRFLWIYYPAALSFIKSNFALTDLRMLGYGFGIRHQRIVIANLNCHDVGNFLAENKVRRRCVVATGQRLIGLAPG